MTRPVPLIFALFILHCTCSISLAAAPAPVAKTGQTTSFVGGDDGAVEPGVTWPSPRFMDNGDQTIGDTLTGLIWSKDAKSPGPTVCGPGTHKTWQGALDHVKCLNANSWLGYSNWNLPNRKELSSLVNIGQANPASWLNTQGFSNAQGSGYWSGSNYAGGADSAWYVGMNNGYVGIYLKTSNSHYVWPVRSGPSGVFGTLTLSPGTAAFAATNASTESEPITFTLANNGAAAIAVSGLAIAGADSDQFSVAPGGTAPCASLTPILAIGANCTVNATFKPAGTGARSAVLHVTSNDAAAPALESTLSGTGVLATDHLCGDCNGNGTVTIAEVQSAINMFLGTKPSDPCVDLDASGGVSISEIQKTINAFLGL